MPLAMVSTDISMRLVDDLVVRFRDECVTIQADLSSAGILLRKYIRAGLKLRIPPESIILTVEGRELNFAECLPREIVTVTFPVGLDHIECSVMLKISTVPRISRFRVPYESDLTFIETLARSTWKLGDIPIEFQFGSFDTDEWTVIPKETKVNTIQFDQGDLTVAQAAQVVVASSVIVPEDSSAESGEYRFVIQDRKDALLLRFPKGSDILAARTQLATELGVELDLIKLLFCGKALKDAFLLDRLHLAGRPITVYVKDMGEVYL
jgi:hypothetical protein